MGQRSDFSRPRQGAEEKSANATRKAVRSTVSNQPSGLLLSPRWPTYRNVYQERCRHPVWGFFVGGGTGLEQQQRRPRPAAETGRSCWGSVLIFQGPAKGPKKNQQTQPVRRCAAPQAISPAGCCLARGGQSIGTSAKKDAADFSIVRTAGTSKGRVSPWRWCPAFCFASPYILRFGSIAAYVRTQSVRTYAGKKESSGI